MDGPKTLVLNRRDGAFGFTLRHFIVYPPDVSDPVNAEKLARCGLANFTQPMDTVFVKKVTRNSEAEFAGLKEGDRIIAVNGTPISLHFQFPDIVSTIQSTSKQLVIQIVPKCYDILQTVSVAFHFSFLIFSSCVFFYEMLAFNREKKCCNTLTCLPQNKQKKK